MDNILTWNATNWITVVLMAAVGFAILGFFAKMVRGTVPTASE